MIKRNKSMVLSFTVSVIGMMIVYYLRGIYPFGELSLLSTDMFNQYVSYFSYLKEILAGDADIFYTFSKNLGGDMIGLTAYYLISPFNLIFLLFPLKYFAEAIMVVSLLKIGFAGLTMNILLNSIKKTNFSLIFSVVYSLMGYTMIYQQNIMWLDGVILLPLIILGVNRIFKGKSFAVYTIFLSFALITNYYIGYMICIFSVIYFMSYLIGKYGFKNKKETLKLFFNYIVGSILGGGLAAFILLPTAFSLSGGKAEFNSSILTFEPNFLFNEFLSKFIIGSTSYQEMRTGLPNIYVGSFVLITLLMYFLNRSICLREKIGTFIGMIVLYSSMYYNALNLGWHGFNYPVWFPYRFSFIFCFYIIVIAYRGFIHPLKSKKDVLVISLISILMGSFWFGTLKNSGLEFLTDKNIHITISYFICYGVLLIGYYLNKERMMRRILLVAILIFTTAELVQNGAETFEQLSHRTRETFVSHVDKTEEIIEEIENTDSEFYRITQDSLLNRNEPMLYHYNGLSHYSSTEKMFVKNFLGDLGNRNNVNWASYPKEQTLSFDSFFNVKYLLAEHTSYPYELVSKGKLDVYRNNYALPVGFMVNANVHHIEPNSTNIFENQNALFSSVLPSSNEPVLKKENYSVSLDSATKEKLNGEVIYHKDKDADYAEVTYLIKASEKAPLYAFFPTNEKTEAELFVNGESFGTYFTTNYYNIVKLGEFNSGEEVQVRLKFANEKMSITEELFYFEDTDIFDSNYKELSKNTFNLKEHSSSYLRGDVEASDDKSTLLFTIPFENSWKVTVDGKRAEIIPAAGTLLSVELSKGKHTIEIKYIPKGFYMGIFITLISIILIILLFKKTANSNKTIFEDGDF